MARNAIILTVPHAACIPAAPTRLCDERALEAAQSLKTALQAEILKRQLDIVVILMPNTTQLRHAGSNPCDANRRGCDLDYQYNYPAGDLQNAVHNRVMQLRRRGIRILLNIDVHSFPLSYSRDHVYFLKRATSSTPTVGLPYPVYQGTEENYFMWWFETVIGVRSILVEFNEDTSYYPDLNADALRIAEYYLK